MARLPDVTDYGARPSLRSNRVDPVHPSGVEVAQGVAAAAEQFARMYGEKKQKDSRLDYALAKNELIGLDIAQREGLKGREDWEQFDDNYTQGYNTGRDEIFERYQRLSPSDRALLSAESDLIRERGRVYASDLARGVEIDEGRATVIRDMNAALGLIQDQPPEQQNEIMLQVFEMIQAASDDTGRTPFFTDVEAENMIQEFVGKAAAQSLDAMEPEQRRAEIELSLAWRKARGGAITREEAMNGEGTGSIADFLHTNVLKDMLEEAEKEDELSKQIGAAQLLVDEVEAANPGDASAISSEVRRLARERNLDPETRARAESMARSRAEEIRVNRNNDRTETMNSMGQMLMVQDEDGNFVNSFENLPPEQLRKLSPTQISQLQTFESRLKNGEQFARSTNWRQPVYDENGLLEIPSYSAWTKMTPAQRAAVDLESPEWYNNFELPVWKQLQDEQRALREGGSDSEKQIQTNDQILTDVWAGELGLPRTGRDEDEDEMFYRMRSEFSTRVDQVSDSEFQGQAVPDDRRKELAREVLSRELYKRDAWWGPVGFIFHIDSDTAVPVGAIDPDQHDEYYVPLHRWRDLPTTIRIGDPPEEIETTWQDRLTRMAATHLDGRVPTQKDLENAYAQILIGGDPAEVRARVLDALAGQYEY